MHLINAEKQRLYRHYGPWVVVTGASSGIGLELAERLAEAGLNVVICARHEERLRALGVTWRAQHNVSIRVVAVDLAEATGSEQLIQQTSDLDIGLLVASAGFGTSGLFVNGQVSDEVAMLRVNCEALLILTHHFAQQMAAKGRGGLILLSSLVAFQGVPYAAHYAATKAYVQSLAEGLARELKPRGVDVLAAAPGPVSSGFEQRARMKINVSLTPAQIGVPILAALGRQTTVLPGWLTKLLTYSLRPVPRWGKVRIMEQVMGGMTAHQR